MNWDDAKYFLAVARAGQMLAAANRLGSSQAKLSRRITALEHALDCQLFERSTTGCKLTEDGQTLLGIAEQIEAGFLRLQTQSRSTHSQVSGVVRIGAPDGFGVAFLAPRLHLLSDRYPDLQIELVPVPQRFSLSQREADIAVMIGRPERGRLRARKLTDYSLGLYASKAYLLAKGTPSITSDLANHRLVGYVEDLLFAEQLNFASEFWAGWKSEIGISSAIGQYQSILSGSGIGVLHDFMASNDENLVPLFETRKLRRTYWTVWHESMKETRRISIVAKFLDEIVRSERAGFISDQSAF